ncbi:hypothetical protein EWM64_g2978 [Hericium alpestre]|uniref:DDE-1 domain-containing protein n=1 Tax=Hericium alpestre TaxID=135208 RepID=A0A4Z0A468_9AGAM|nr:hypothetical protein EWM64_g2978 [Hericium alpestre]
MEVLKPYPKLIEAIITKLKQTRKIGIPLAVDDISAIMISMIQIHAPEVFLKVAGDGSMFRCSNSFVRHFLDRHHWSSRSPTKAAQKMPLDTQEQCRRSFFQQAFTVQNEGTKDYLRANTDQTNSLLGAAAKQTYDETGVKQVAVVGMEEKHAFTLVVGVTASGEALPFQAIYKGKTSQSLPVKTPFNSKHWKRVQELGFLLEPSGNDTYWSTMDTMKSYVNYILTPYFAKAHTAHGDPEDQLVIWQIDA